eukprot:COSAG02_NODE_1051_length_14956_cov_3.414216_17_plen_51_part_00
MAPRTFALAVGLGICASKMAPAAVAIARKYLRPTMLEAQTDYNRKKRGAT